MLFVKNPFRTKKEKHKIEQDGTLILERVETYAVQSSSFHRV